MSGRVVVPAAFRAARVAALQADLMAKQAELVQLLSDDELVARASFEGEVAAIAAAPAPAPAPAVRRRRKKNRRRVVATGTSDQDIREARRALREKGMLPR